MIQPPENLRQFESLLEIVKALRGPGGCPWDKEQSHRSLAPFAIEEAHEFAAAVEAGDQTEMIDELGDLLLQVALNAEIGRGEGRFSAPDVIEAVSTKMVRRHPHVFANARAEDATEVLRNWAEIKKAEKPNRAQSSFDVPIALPALARAEKIGAKTKTARFDWSNWREVFAKIDEERDELKVACEGGSRAEQEHELGDLLFSAAQLARHLSIDAEQSLRAANARFERRYFAMRALAKDEGEDFEALTPERKENYWRRAKALESRPKI